jgi:hypothetical protein
MSADLKKKWVLITGAGGPKATNPVEAVLPGALVPALLDDDTQGQLFRALDYAPRTPQK